MREDWIPKNKVGLKKNINLSHVKGFFSSKLGPIVTKQLGQDLLVCDHLLLL